MLLTTAVLAAALPSGCDRPVRATEADVLVIVEQPRTAEQEDALAAEGRRLYLRHNCHNCHVVEGATRGAPRLANLYRTTATLIDGQVISRDTAYLARSILKPQAEVVAGYPQQMTQYGHLPAEEVAAIIAYLHTLSPPPAEAPEAALAEQPTDAKPATDVPANANGEPDSP